MRPSVHPEQASRVLRQAQDARLARRRVSFLLFFLSAIRYPLYTAAAEDSLQFARGEHYLIERNFTKALEEFGRLSKEEQSDPKVLYRIHKAANGFYSVQNRLNRPRKAPRPAGAPPAVTHSLRVTRAKRDAESSSDQSFDNRGWQVNESLSAGLQGTSGIKGYFRADLAGHRNGHNDVRYRTLLADFTKNQSHVAIGDSATFTSPFFLRGAPRFRGLNLWLEDDSNLFQAVAGTYPVWIEQRDSYVYPRSVFGLWDRKGFWNNRLRLGGGILKTRDNEEIQTLSASNQARENVVFSIDQTLNVIPNVWSIKAAEAASYTDDNLDDDRFGDTSKLKGTASEVDSNLVLPAFTLKSRLERIGPDFRAVSDPGSRAFSSNKTITVDRQFIQHLMDFRPWGPLDLDLETSWYRNDLDNDDSIPHLRRSWYTANLGWKLPEHWPQPRWRLSLIESVDSPGSVFRPSQTRTLDLNNDWTAHWGRTAVSAFGSYEIEMPQAQRDLFDEQTRWALGTRLSRPFGEKVLLSSRYKYSVFDEIYNAVRQNSFDHEINTTGSIRLFSTANLSLGYTFRTGKLIAPTVSTLDHENLHSGSATFGWPLQLWRQDRRRKWTIHPSVSGYLSSVSRDREQRPLTTGRLALGYEAFNEWKLELLGEFRYDKDTDFEDVRTEESRIWMLWTSQWK